MVEDIDMIDTFARHCHAPSPHSYQVLTWRMRSHKNVKKSKMSISSSFHLGKRLASGGQMTYSWGPAEFQHFQLPRWLNSWMCFEEIRNKRLSGSYFRTTYSWIVSLNWSVCNWSINRIFCPFAIRSAFWTFHTVKSSHQNDPV